MKKHIPRTLHYGCLMFSAIGILPSLLLMYSFFIIAQKNALTPKHFVLLIYCFLNVGLVGTLIATMRNGKRWSMMTTTTLLVLSLFSEFMQAYTSPPASDSHSLFILLFWPILHFLTLALILAPSTQCFFTRNDQSRKLQFFLKSLALLPPRTQDCA